MIAVASPVPDSVSGESPRGCDAPELVELSLLMPRVHFRAIETAAGERGLTIAQYLRRLIGRSVAPPDAD
jgi:hypothetical protein